MHLRVNIFRVIKAHLVILFKCYESMCKWKSVIETRVMLFKQHNQTSPRFMCFIPMLLKVHLGALKA